MMSTAFDYLGFFCVAYAALVALYFMVNGACYWVFYSGRWGDWTDYRIQPDKRPAPGQVRREIVLSVLNLAFFGLTATVDYGFYRQGWTQIYLDLSARSWWYFAASVLLIIAIHDTYFYWMHRLLHWKPLFRRVHRVHHLSLTPTSWAGYATHWGEGLLMSGNFLIYPLLFPVHPLAIVLYVVIQNIYSTLGHCGYDSFPPWLRRRWYLAWHNFPTHHDNHHRYTNGNYGHFANCWDRLMGTELREHRTTRQEAQTAEEPDEGIGREQVCHRDSQ